MSHMSSDLVDMPPEMQRMQDELDAAKDRELDAHDGVMPELGLLSVTLPAAPGSREAALSNLAEPVRVTREFFDNVLNACWLLSMQGAPIDPDAIMRVAPAAFKEGQIEIVRAVLASEKMRLALIARGIDADRTRADGLSAEMQLCIRALTDPTLGLTVEQRLKTVKVSWAQYQGWMSFGPFREALTLAGEGSLKSMVQVANTALNELVAARDLKAIQYMHTLTGYFTPGKQQALDVQQLITEVMTAVLRKVKDPEVLLEVAAEFRLIQERLRFGSGGEPGSGEPGALTMGFGESAATIDVALDAPEIQIER